MLEPSCGHLEPTNRLLVREGHAWAFPFEPNTTFASSLQTAEQQASAEGAGLWSNCNY